MRKSLRTSDIAKAVGVHPNTVRLYEEWGFLPAIPRTTSGYRQFNEFHLDQMCFARTALHGGWPGRKIRQSALALVRCAAAGELEEALAMAQTHEALVQGEIDQAETAVLFIQQWLNGEIVELTRPPLSVSQTARFLDVSTDQLRDWERNGLLTVPRHPQNRYRQYGAAEIGRVRVIRTLRRAGYSTLAILRMLLAVEQDSATDIRQALDTATPEDDIQYATNQWLTTLTTHKHRAADMISQLETMVSKYARC
ncbi:MAG: MerR family transcriptional regulator [Anaerolineae bacterium]|nr:MerR family transcriptional regulator [Anaerolineae bacterium]